MVTVIVAATACAQSSPERWTDPATQIQFVLVPAWKFVRGSPANEPGHQQRVRLTQAFYLSIHEVSRRQWNIVMPTARLGAPDRDADTPIVNVSWFEANGRCVSRGDTDALRDGIDSVD